MDKDLEEWFQVLWNVALFPLMFCFAGRMVAQMPDDYFDTPRREEGFLRIAWANAQTWPYLHRAAPRLFYLDAAAQAAVGAAVAFWWKPGLPMAATAGAALVLLAATALTLYMRCRPQEKGDNR